MAATSYRPLKLIAFNASGISRQRYELNKQLQDLHIDVALLSETSQTPWEGLYSNLSLYRTDRFPGRKGGTSVAVRKGISHNHVDLPALVSVEATGICMPIGNSEVLLATVCKSPDYTWSDEEIINLFSFRH
jgi:hypothetical protein